MKRLRNLVAALALTASLGFALAGQGPRGGVPTGADPFATELVIVTIWLMCVL